jgi:hypothetical protein
METIKIHISYTNEKIGNNLYMFNYSIILQDKPYKIINGYITFDNIIAFIDYCTNKIKNDLDLSNNTNIKVTQRNLNFN